MTPFSLITLPADANRAHAESAASPAGGGNASERDFALAVALVAIAAAFVLAFAGA